MLRRLIQQRYRPRSNLSRVSLATKQRGVVCPVHRQQEKHCGMLHAPSPIAVFYVKMCRLRGRSRCTRMRRLQAAAEGCNLWRRDEGNFETK